MTNPNYTPCGLPISEAKDCREDCSTEVENDCLKKWEEALTYPKVDLIKVLTDNKNK